jgi:hypothetical protein
LSVPEWSPPLRTYAHPDQRPPIEKGGPRPSTLGPPGPETHWLRREPGLCMPKVASWQLLLTFPAGPTSPWPRSSEKSIEQKAQRRISVYVVRATSYDPFANRVVTESRRFESKCYRGDLVYLRLTLNFLPREPNRST